MSTIQKMEDAVYDNTVDKESQSMAIKDGSRGSKCP